MDVIDLIDYLSAIGKSPTGFVDKSTQRLTDAPPNKRPTRKPKATRGKS